MISTEKSSEWGKNVVKMKGGETFFQHKGQTAILVDSVFRANIAGVCSAMEGSEILGPAKEPARAS